MTLLQRHILVLLAILMPAIHAAQTSRADEIGFIEKYALAENREAVLENLIPGSEEYYYYHCLHYQVSGDLNRAEAMLSDWESKIRNDSPLRIAIRDRQRLLTYGASPDRTIEYLRDRLSIRFDHSAPPQAGERRWPDTLDQAVINPGSLLRDAARNRQPISELGLAWLADRTLAGEANQYDVNLEWLTQQFNGRWYSRLGELVIMELRARRPEQRSFGDRAAHAHLTLSELKKLIEVFPDFANNRQLINQILVRMRPSEDSDISDQPEVRFEYLQSVYQFVSTLPSSQNSLKAAALYRLLEANLTRGQYPLPLFLDYLKLPRLSPIIYVDPRFPGRTQPNPANLNEDFSGAALLPPIRDEQPLVRAYLEHFLQDAASTQQFEGLIEKDYLNRIFAETKLLYGIGQPQQWYDMLNAAQRQTLTESVELTLSAENPHFLTSDGVTKVLLDVKGVDELIVRVYEINTHAYYRTRTEKIDTNIDLDGLVATEEQRLEYKFPKIRRHREQIELPTVTGRGVWIVDFLGGGLRSRAILRRGELRYLEQQTANGQVFTILDENRNAVPQASLLIAGRELSANENGQITVPPVDKALTRNAVLMDEQIAVPLLMIQNGEQYSLQARFVVNRQQLLAGQTAELVIRPRLYMSSTPVDPAMLEDVTVTVVATDQDGVSTTRRFDNVQLDQLQETVVKFRVPARLAQLTATLSGQIKTLATGRQVMIQDAKAWDVNGTDQTANTMDVHLTLDGDQWIAEVRGLNGEPVSGAAVQIVLNTVFRQSQVNATLETNEQGRIVLGILEGVQHLSLSISGNTISRFLDTGFSYWPERLHGTSDQVIQLPVAEPLDENSSQFRLLELRAGQPAEDVTGSLLKLEPGMVVVGPLPAGDYSLFREDDGYYSVTHLAITEGPVVSGVAAGQIRNLELQWSEAVSIKKVETLDDGVEIELAGDLDLARVHVIGRRYLPNLERPSLPLPAPNQYHVDIPESGYVSDLRLGDEYLYVLRRQYAKKYPGVMLPQPSLLIAPWVTDETNNSRNEAGAGEAPPPSAAADNPEPRSQAAKRDLAKMAQEQLTQSLEFLSNPGVVLTNLRPDKDGKIKVSREQLNGLHLIEVIAIDPYATVSRVVAYPINSLEPRDRRLTKSLPQDTPFQFDREVLVAGPNKPLQMSSLGTAQIQLYTELREVLELYRTISGDSRLDEFVEIGRWHALDEQAKRQLYGRLACHELHIFLKYKDPQFFDTVVRPYLANKKEKKLVDDWLLGNDLTAWTELWRYAQLNAFEKSLLAHAVPAIRETVLRDLREQIALQDPDPAQLRQLIDVGLAGKALQSEPALGSVMFRNNRMDAKEMVDALSFGAPAAPGGFGGGGAGADFFAEAEADGAVMEKAEVQERLNEFRSRRMSRGAMSSRTESLGRAMFFQQLDSTKQWADNHWDHVRVTNANSSLIPIDPFWLDWAEKDDASQLLSSHLLRPTSNRHAALVSLALLDLPFESEGVELPTDSEGVFQPSQFVAIITKRLRELESSNEAASLLVGQRFEPTNSNQNNPFVDGEEVKIAPDEFIIGTAYRGQIVVTNPTPQMRKVEVLWQIPSGSLPIAGSQATDSRTLQIAPFEVQRIDYQFYFPQPGDFLHYPVCISNNAKVVARGEPRTFNVVSTPTKIDEASWEQVARTATPDKIRQFLSKANLQQLDWSLVTHRLRDRAVYDSVLSVLENSKIWQPELWAYSLLYRDQPRISSYLEMRSDLVQSVGPVLRSQLLEIKPIPRALYEHLEYAPLVPDRIHPLRSETEIMNDRLLGQYRSFMRVIAYQPSADSQQRLALCYYLLIQNRIEEAINMFAELNREQVETQLQYDYLAAYLALHQANYKLAGEISEKHADHPVPRWRERFVQLQNQLQQRRDLLSGSKLVGSSTGNTATEPGVREDAADLAVMDRERRLADGAASAPDLQVRVEGDALVIDHRNTPEAVVRFYGIDLELLFSKTPFVRDGLDRMAMVRPSTVESITLGTGDGSARYPLGEKLARQTLLVEVVSGSARDTTLYYGGRLKTYVSEGFGQLQVSDRTTAEPVTTAYVKVYSKDRSGKTQFYKDGYTDMRGRFDYATLSAGDLGQVDKFAILVLDPERGATLHEVSPPTK